MVSLISNFAAILDNVTEGYPVTVTRVDGFTYVISMARTNGDEVYSYQFGRIKRDFRSLEDLVSAIIRFDFVSIKF